MKVDGSLKSLLQGVSQQPPRDRLIGQATLQENFISDPVTGLTRRPPTDLVGDLGSATNVKGWHPIKTRDGGRFLAWFHDNTVRVFDLNANPQAVSISPGAVSYLSANGTVRATTDDEDNTLFVNRAVSTAMETGTVTYFNSNGSHAAIIQVLGGAYGRTYTIYQDGASKASFLTVDGSLATQTPFVSTNYIANQLAGQLTTNMPGFAVSRTDDVILIHRVGDPFTMTASDSAGGINVKSMNNSVTDIGDLPRYAPHLYVIRVAEKTDPDKDLWFKFVVESMETVTTPGGGFGKSGYWQECVAPNTPHKVNSATMPHSLTYNGTSFQCGPCDWKPRRVGTTVSNPTPSFIGNTIQDVSSFQGRSVLIAGANVCMSRTNEPYDHWFGSAAALTDTDPIDINSTVDSSNMMAIVQHNRDLVVFSNEAQFVVFGRTKITPETASLVMTTRFESEVAAHPVGAGRNVFFASNYGSYTAAREFFAEGNSDINDSRPITQHVKKYLEGKATHLSASSNYDMLMVHTTAVRTSTYIYQYIWSDTEKVQSAWHVWKMAHSIVYSFFDEDQVYYVQLVNGRYYLLRMPLDVQSSAGVPYPVYLDQRFDVDSVDTAFILPFDYLATDQLVCVQGEGCPNPGLLAPIASVTYDAANAGYRVTLKKSLGGGSVVVGTRFLSAYKPTMPTVKDADGVVVGTGNLTVRMFLLSLFNSGEVIGRTVSKYGASEEVRFNGRVIGNIDNVVGVQPMSNEQFLMPFRQSADEAEVEFYTNSHLPLTILDIEWVGQYSKRGRRIGNGSK